MTFISYAQNFEDVILKRALKDVKKGFYIDVGANDPEEDSVTKAFYDRDWHGVNIEPLPEHYKALVEKRPRDINLAIAAGEADGELTLFEVPEVRGWASLSCDVASNHKEEGFTIDELKVPVKTLDAICEEYAAGDIHFLKIDVEGFELEVVRGADFEKWRPWILVIEATLPNSQEPSYETWESILFMHRYSFAYFDGLNRYYVAEEHKDLLSALTVQPNVFDSFTTINQAKAVESAQQAEAKAEQAQAKAEQAELKLNAIYNSYFWRVTKPVRWILRILKGNGDKG